MHHAIHRQSIISHANSKSRRCIDFDSLDPLWTVASLPALGPWAPPAERGPSLESIYRVSLAVDPCEGNANYFLKNISPQLFGAPQIEKKIRGPWARAQCAHWLRRPWLWMLNSVNNFCLAYGLCTVVSEPDPARHIGREGPSLAFRVMGKGARPEGPKPEAKKAESREWG